MQLFRSPKYGVDYDHYRQKSSIVVIAATAKVLIENNRIFLEALGTSAYERTNIYF